MGVRGGGPDAEYYWKIPKFPSIHQRSMKTMMPVQPQPPVSFRAPYPAARPRRSLLIGISGLNYQASGVRRCPGGVIAGLGPRGTRARKRELHCEPRHQWAQLQGQVAQLVEQRTENPRVGSSILPLAIKEDTEGPEKDRRCSGRAQGSTHRGAESGQPIAGQPIAGPSR